MRRCFYHTDLGQNALFHNFAIQIALSQYSGRSKHVWAFSETIKQISKISYTASRFSLLIMINKAIRFNVIKNLLCLFFYLMVL